MLRYFSTPGYESDAHDENGHIMHSPTDMITSYQWNVMIAFLVSVEMAWSVIM